MPNVFAIGELKLDSQPGTWPLTSPSLVTPSVTPVIIAPVARVTISGGTRK